MHYDNWDIDCYYTEKFWDVTDVQRMEWTNAAPVRATLELSAKVSPFAHLPEKFTSTPRARISSTLRRRSTGKHQHLLKAHFPMDVHTDEATFEIQFGNVTQKHIRTRAGIKARFETAAKSGSMFPRVTTASTC